MPVFLQNSRNNRIVPTGNIFSAVFNATGKGVYDFSSIVNTSQVVIPLQSNSVFFIDTFQLSGNIPETDFISAIVKNPELTFRTLKDGKTIFSNSFSIVDYSERAVSAFVNSQKKEDSLIVDFSGILKMTENLIGITPINITLSVTIYAIDESEYNRKYQDKSEN